jgi:hypothetical protein
MRRWLLLGALAAASACGSDRSTATRGGPTNAAPSREGFALEDGAIVAHGRAFDARVIEGAVALRRGGAALQLRDEVRVDGVPASLLARWSLEGGRLARVDRDGASEIALRADGLRQAWRFDRQPARGDLEVRVSLDGLAFDRVTSRGVHFVDRATGARFRYGHATWIDARGARTPIDARFEGTRVVLRVPSSVLATSAFPAVLDPVLSPELTVDAPIPMADWSAHRSNTHAASGGGKTFVAWMDDNTFAPITTKFIATLVDAGGTPISPSGFPLPGSDAVAFDGVQFVNVWTEQSSVVKVARVTPAGALLDPAGIVVATSTSSSASSAHVASSPGLSLVGWIDGSTTRIARVKADGTVLDPGGIALAGGSGTLDAIAWNGTCFVVLLESPTSIGASVVRVATDGTVLDATPIAMPLSTGSNPPFVLAGSPGGTSLLVYSSMSGIRAQRLGVDGKPIGSATLLDSFNASATSVAWNGSNWVVAWNTLANDVASIRIATDGTLIGASTLVVAGPVTYGDAACSGTNCFVTWIGNDWSTYGGRIGPTGTPLDGAGIDLSTTTARRTAPTATIAGGKLLVAWSDNRDPAGTDVFARTFDATPTALAPSFRPFSSGPMHLGPALATNGTSTLHASLGSTAVATRIDPSTPAALDPAGVPLAVTSAVGTQSALAIAGATSLLAFQGTTSTSGGSTILGVRVDATAHPIGAAFPIPPKANNQLLPAVATDGKGFVVAWAEKYAGGVNVAHVGLDGTVGATTPISNVTGGKTAPALAWGGGTYLGVWADGRAITSMSIYAVRLDSTGTPLPPEIPIAVGPGQRGQPSVAWDGDAFLVAWQDCTSSSCDVRATWVSADARVRGPELAITNTLLLDEALPKATSDGAGVRAVVYTRIDYGDTGGEQVHGRFVTAAGNGARCATTADCASGFCVDGVCCESACTAQCAACDLPGSLGACVPVRGAPHGTRAACGGTGAGSTCGAVCDGADSTGCHYPPGGTLACGVDACSGGVETHVSTCDGAGSCGDVPIACGNYGCGATACNQSCTTSANCAPTAYCQSGVCVPRLPLGAKCVVDGDCASAHCTDGACCGVASCGNGSSCGLRGDGTCAKTNGTACANAGDCGSGTCVDGVCCDRACDRQCEACDDPTSRGTCKPIGGAPHGARPACGSAGTNTCAALACDGSKADRCAAYASGPSVECAAARCEGGRAYAAEHCDGNGACVHAMPHECGGYACSAGDCLTACQTKDDCAQGFGCNAGKCEASQAQCSDDGTISNANDGTPTVCNAFKCNPATGLCGTSCGTDADCLGGYECATDQTCRPRPPPSPSDGGGGGGGCAASPRSPSGSLALLGLFASILFVVRRRR